MARVWWKDQPRDPRGRFTYVSHKGMRNVGIPPLRKPKRRRAKRRRR